MQAIIAQTKERWYMNNKHFAVTVEDYGVVGALKPWVAEHVYDHNSTPHPSYGGYHSPGFLAYYNHREGRHFGSYSKHLLYLDVEGTPGHAQGMVAKVRSSYVAEQPDAVDAAQLKMYEAVKKKYVDACNKYLAARELGPPDSVAKEAKNQDLEEQIRDLSLADSDFKDLDHEWLKCTFFPDDFPYGYYVRGIVVDYIIQLRSPEEKKVALWSISQSNSTRPRPTIFLISMFDDRQSTTASQTTGYRIGYEFVTNTVIAEPFVSTTRINPFHQLWSLEDHHTTDTRLCGTPGTVTTSILQDSCLTDPARASENSRLGFYNVICLEVTRWILDHYDALQSIEPETLTDEVKGQLKSKRGALKTQLASIPFPKKVKDTRQSLTSKGNHTTALHVQNFFEIEVLSIDTQEVEYRKLALDIKL